MKALLIALAASSLSAGAAMAAPSNTEATVTRHLGPPTAEACGRLGQQAVAPDGVPLFKRLDQLPKGVLEHAVWRTVGGCPVREIRFEGRTWYVTSGNPQVERLDPVTRK